MDYPFLNTSKLTDEEILDKISKLSDRLAAYTSLGHNPTVESINPIIDALVAERNRRLSDTMAAEAKKKNPNANAPIELGAIDKVDPQKYDYTWEARNYVKHSED